mmetsp:Transcript_13780/g.35386  ORF Transcript_13780/g.35386 Transcript_13780/m.35386 type:complete len:242 (+) Transcript_13780:369-1094(+)
MLACFVEDGRHCARLWDCSLCRQLYYAQRDTAAMENRGKVFPPQVIAAEQPSRLRGGRLLLVVRGEVLQGAHHLLRPQQQHLGVRPQGGAHRLRGPSGGGERVQRGEELLRGAQPQHLGLRHEERLQLPDDQPQPLHQHLDHGLDARLVRDAQKLGVRLEDTRDGIGAHPAGQHRLARRHHVLQRGAAPGVEHLPLQLQLHHQLRQRRRLGVREAKLAQALRGLLRGRQVHPRLPPEALIH